MEEEADIEATEGVRMDEEATEVIEAQEEVVEEVDITKTDLKVLILEQNYHTH